MAAKTKIITRPIITRLEEAEGERSREEKTEIETLGENEGESLRGRDREKYRDRGRLSSKKTLIADTSVS